MPPIIQPMPFMSIISMPFGWSPTKTGSRRPARPPEADDRHDEPLRDWRETSVDDRDHRHQIRIGPGLSHDDIQPLAENRVGDAERDGERSEERSVGKECVSPWRSRGSP